MNESILDSTKLRLGIDPTITDFDAEIVPLINLAINTLYELGLGPSGSFKIIDNSTVWSDYLHDDKRLEMVKDYIFFKTKLLFDSVTTPSAVIEIMKEQIKELESRISYMIEPGEAYK